MSTSSFQYGLVWKQELHFQKESNYIKNETKLQNIKNYIKMKKALWKNNVMNSE